MSYHREGEEGPCDQCVMRKRKPIQTGKFYHDSGWFQCDFHRNRMYLPSRARTDHEPMADISEAQRMVVDVWVKLTADWRKKTPLPPWMLRIKDGYKHNRKFYNALQAVITNHPPEWDVHLAGAPSHICERDGVRLENHLGVPKLFVYFELTKLSHEGYGTRWMPPIGEQK